MRQIKAIEIVSSSGQLVFSKSFEAPVSVFEWRTRADSPGVYFCRILAEDAESNGVLFSDVKKMMRAK